MNYTIEELNPSLPNITVNKITFDLRLMSLKDEVTFISSFGSLEKMREAVEKDGKKFLEVIWHLVLDKNLFGKSFTEFLTSVLGDSSNGEELQRGLQEVLNKSMPIIKNEKRMKEIQEIRDIETNAKPCYAKYFDIIAHRYGYTLEKFYDLTVRQLQIILQTIGDKQYEELEVQAALHGRKLKPRLVFDDISPEQEEEQINEAREAVKKLQANYLKNQQEK